AQAFVRTEGLVFHCSQRGFVDVGAHDVPAWREARLEEHQWPPSIGDDAVTMANHESTRGLSDVDAMVAVGSMAQDPFVFFIKGIHSRPRKCHPCLQFTRPGG